MGFREFRGLGFSGLELWFRVWVLGFCDGAHTFKETAGGECRVWTSYNGNYPPENVLEYLPNLVSWPVPRRFVSANGSAMLPLLGV